MVGSIFAKSTATVWTNPTPEARARAQSHGETEIPPKERDEGIMSKIYQVIYPPNSDYYWYRYGKVSRSPLSNKFLKFFLLNLVIASAGSGVIVGLAIYLVHLSMQIVYTAPVQVFSTSSSMEDLERLKHVSINTTALMMREVRPEWVQLIDHPMYMFIWMILSGITTMLVYTFGAEWYRRSFYLSQSGEAEENWKCQPYRHLNPDIEREEWLMGSFNSFLAGFLGLGLFFLDQHYGPVLLLYYDLSRGYFHFFRGFILCWLWVDCWSYWAHRLLHTKFLYTHVHKWHHRYQTPTAYSAFAMSPWEFFIFQSAGVFCTCVFEVHVVAFLAAVLQIAYHNQVDHSGIFFEGDMPWCPSSKYHDDHHKLFHLNFGVQFVFWDWAFGTLRKKNREYSEDTFVAVQKDKTKTN